MSEVESMSELKSIHTQVWDVFLFFLLLIYNVARLFPCIYSGGIEERGSVAGNTKWSDDDQINNVAQ